MSAADDNTAQPVSVADVAVQAAALTHIAGRSKNTVDADKPALNLFNYYWKYVLMRAGGIDEEYIEEDNLTSLFILYTHLIPMDRTELFTLASKVEERAFKKMYEFEGKNVEEEMENNKKNGSRAPKPTYQGLGKRVFKYKKDLARRRGLSDADIKKFGKDEDLIERPSDMAL